MTDEVLTRFPVREFARRGLVHLSLSTVAIAQPLLGLYGENLAVFTSARFQGAVIVWFAVAAILVPPLVLTILDVGITAALSRRAPRLASAAHPAVVFVGLWACMASVFHSVSVGPWPIDAILTAAVAVAGVVGYRRVAPVRTWLTWISPLAPAVLVLFVVSVSSLVWVPAPETVEATPGGGAQTTSVLWIQLDEAPLFPLVGADGAANAARFPGFAALAARSTWYPNALTVSQHTAVAVPSMLSGLAPDYSRQPVSGDHRRNVFSLVGSSHVLDVVEEVTALCPGIECVAGAVTPTSAPGQRGTDNSGPVVRRRASFGAFLSDAAVVLGHRLLPAGLRDWLPPIDEGWGGFGDQAGGSGNIGTDDDTEPGANQPSPGGAASVAPSREKPRGHAGRTAAIEAMVTRTLASTDPAFRFIHVLLPHRPWVLAPDLRKSQKMSADPRPDTIPDRRRDNYQSLLNQYVAVDGIISRMIGSLSASPVWDDLMLIVTADHGITFVPGQSYRDTVNPQNRSTLDDIYRVPFFVKYPGQREGLVDECAASTLDLFATVQATLRIDSGWETDGLDLSSSCPDERNRVATWPGGSTPMTVNTDDLEERVAWYGRWVDADGDVDAIYRTGPAGELVGTRAPTDAGRDERFRVRLGNDEEFTGVGSAPFEPVPTRAVGTIKASTALPDGTEVLVAVDGIIVGEVREASDARPGEWTHFSASLMSRLIGPGDHEVTFWTARRPLAGGRWVLRRIG